MIVLDTTTRKIQVTMDATAATTESPVVAAYDDISSSATVYTSAASNTITSGTGQVDCVAAPAASTQRLVKYLSCRNDDTNPRICTFRYNDNGTARNLVSATLQAGDALVYVNGQWYVISKLGASAIPSGIVNGDLIYGTGANVLSRLAVGTQGQVLQAGSTRPQWANLFNYATKSGNYTVAQSDSGTVLDVTTGSSADVTITLPASSGTLQGIIIGIRKFDSGTKTVIIAPNALDGINGNTVNVSTKLTAQNAVMFLICTGQTGVNAWEVVSTNGDWLAASTASVSPVSNTYTSMASIVLTPGEWEISGCATMVVGASSGTASAFILNVNNSVGVGTPGDNSLVAIQAWTQQQQATLTIPSYRRVVTAATETWNLNCSITWATTQATANGRISARRIR